MENPENEVVALRPYSPEEMRTMLLDHMKMMVDYWVNLDLEEKKSRLDSTKPEDAAYLDYLDKKGEVRYKLEGFVHSMLVMFDGGSMSIPALDIIPSPHETDEEYHKAEGENWWPNNEKLIDTIRETAVINDCQLHDLWNATR